MTHNGHFYSTLCINANHQNIIQMTMNKSLSLLLVLFLTLSGCNKIDDLLTFSISSQTTIRLENTLTPSLPFEIATPDVTTDANQKFQNNNTKADLVKDVRLEELKLTITNPANKTFSFLKSIHIFISTNSTDEIELAYLDDISSTATEIILIPTKEKLDTYVKASSYKLRTTIITRETLSTGVDLKLNSKFKVTAAAL